MVQLTKSITDKEGKNLNIIMSTSITKLPRIILKLPHKQFVQTTKFFKIYLIKELKLLYK